MTDVKNAALIFVDRFCSGDVEGLRILLCDDFKFEGPLLRTSTREEYLSKLAADPPEPARCEILQEIEQEDQIAVFYRYHKQAGVLTLAQWFRLRENRIAESMLIFSGFQPR